MSPADSVTKHARKAENHVLIVYSPVVPPVLYLLLFFLIDISEYLSPFREISILLSWMIEISPRRCDRNILMRILYFKKNPCSK